MWHSITCLWHIVLVWALNCLTCGLDQVILEMQQQLMQQGGSSRAHSIILHALQGLHHQQAFVTALVRSRQADRPAGNQTDRQAGVRSMCSLCFHIKSRVQSSIHDNANGNSNNGNNNNNNSNNNNDDTDNG